MECVDMGSRLGDLQDGQGLIGAERCSTCQLNCDGQRLDRSGFFPGYVVWDGDGHGWTTGEVLAESAICRVHAAVLQVCADVWVPSQAELAANHRVSLNHVLYLVPLSRGCTHVMHAKPGSTATRCPTKRSFTPLPTSLMTPEDSCPRTSCLDTLSDS